MASRIPSSMARLRQRLLSNPTKDLHERLVIHLRPKDPSWLSASNLEPNSMVLTSYLSNQFNQPILESATDSTMNPAVRWQWATPQINYHQRFHVWPTYGHCTSKSYFIQWMLTLCNDARQPDGLYLVDPNQLPTWHHVFGYIQNHMTTHYPEEWDNMNSSSMMDYIEYKANKDKMRG